VAASGAKFAVAPAIGRMPDVTVYFAGDPRPPLRGLIRTPPSIAVEVLSPTPRDGRRDRVEKLAEYARFGIRWYWLVDPQLRSIEILELVSRRYQHVTGLTEGLVDVPGCEGLRIDVSELWATIESPE